MKGFEENNVEEKRAEVIIPLFIAFNEIIFK